LTTRASFTSGDRPASTVCFDAIAHPTTSRTIVQPARHRAERETGSPAFLRMGEDADGMCVGRCGGPV
jgi:hypothetical protein